MEFLDQVATEPVGRAGVRVVGFNNPPPFLKRTLVNRNEAETWLEGTELHLSVDDKLLAAIKGGKPAMRAHEDPSIYMGPPLRFQYMTEVTMDPKTGMPKVLRKKGKAKALAAKLATFKLTKFRLYSETSKMSAPSWAVTAGPPSAAGSCQAAELFKNRAQYNVALRQGDVSQRAPNKKEWICSYCYAGKSNYMHRTSQYTQMARLVWMKGMIDAHGLDYTADLMGITLAAHMWNAKVRADLGESTDYFRVHDSGDFTLVPDTYTLWMKVASMPELAHVHFWAPTRMWGFPKFQRKLRENPPPPNFTIRPSALHFNDIAPGVEGFSAGSTAHSKEFAGGPVDPVKTGNADWVCPAYQHDGKSCAGGGGPRGEKDCRACWDYRGLAVSYKAH